MSFVDKIKNQNSQKEFNPLNNKQAKYSMLVKENINGNRLIKSSPVPFTNLQKRFDSKTVSPNKRENFRQDDEQHSTYKKLKDMNDRKFLREFTSLVNDNDLKLLNKIPEIKSHVKDVELYLPKIQIKHSQLHRKNMVKDWMKERLMEFARRHGIIPDPNSFHREQVAVQNDPEDDEIPPDLDQNKKEDDKKDKKEKNVKKNKTNKLKTSSIAKKNIKDLKDVPKFELQRLNIDAVFEDGGGMRNENDITNIILKRFEYEIINNNKKIQERNLQKDISKPRLDESPIKKIEKQNEEQNSSKRNQDDLNHQYKFIYNNKNKLYEKDFKVNWKHESNNSFVPQTRDCATWTASNGHFYLFGGRSQELFSNIVIYDQVKKTWFELNNIDDINKPDPRQAHTACQQKNKLYISCGCKFFNLNSQRRDCLADLKQFDLINQRWQTCPPLFKPRRQHSAVMYLNCLMIQGGMDDNDILMEDMNVFNCQTEGWSKQNETLEGEKLPAICQHAACGVITAELDSSGKHSMFQHPAYLWDNSEERRLSIGTFIFGGLVHHYTPRGELEEKAVNALYFVQTGKTKFKVFQVHSRNKGPSPRQQHSMNFDQKNQQLIVQGGKNKQADDWCLKDMWFFNCIDFSWFKTSLQGTVPAARHSHCAVIHDSTIILFGGIGERNYCNNLIFSGNYEQSTLKKEFNIHIPNQHLAHPDNRANRKKNLIYMDTLKIKKIGHIPTDQDHNEDQVVEEQADEKQEDDFEK